MKRNSNNKLIGAILIQVIVYIVAFTCIMGNSTYGAAFKLLPALLLVAAFILFLFHKEWNRDAVIFMLIIYGSASAVEVAGVRTGRIFGVFFYPEDSGIQIIGMSLLTGMNWLILVYCTGNTVNKIRIHTPWKELTGAALVTLIDFLIEPVANHLNWWHWKNAEAPLQNYIAWFYLSFIFLFYFFKVKANMDNPIAVPVLVIVILFLVGLNYSLI